MGQTLDHCDACGSSVPAIMTILRMWCHISTDMPLSLVYIHSFFFKYHHYLNRAMSDVQKAYMLRTFFIIWFYQHEADNGSFNVIYRYTDG